MKAEPPLDRTDKAQQVCPECQIHYSRPEQKNRDHLRAWQAVAADLEGRRRAAVARAVAAEKLAEDNRMALNDAMRVSVEGFFQDGNIGDELRARLGAGVNDEGVRLAGRAFRQRARALNAILFVADRHADDSDTAPASAASGPRGAASSARSGLNSPAPTSGSAVRSREWTEVSITSSVLITPPRKNGSTVTRMNAGAGSPRGTRMQTRGVVGGADLDPQPGNARLRRGCGRGGGLEESVSARTMR